MELMEFCENIVYTLESKMSNYSFKIDNVEKINQQHYTTIICHKDGSNYEKVIYAEPLFERYQKGTSIVDIINNFEKVIISENDPIDGMNLDSFTNYELASNRICFKIIGVQHNKDMLKKMPHRIIEDLAIVYYYLVGNSSSDGIIHILNSHLDLWGKNESDLYEVAMKNTPSLNQAKITSLENVFRNRFSGSNLRNDIYTAPDECTDYETIMVMTNPDKTYGAATVLYPGVLRTIGEKFGSDFYIIPSSLHEVLLVKAYDKFKADELIEMVKTVNATEVEPEDLLSDNVYRYYMRNDTFSSVLNNIPLSA